MKHKLKKMKDSKNLGFAAENANILRRKATVGSLKMKMMKMKLIQKLGDT